MLQTTKYKYLSVMTERLFLGIMFAFFATMNYMILIQSGLLQQHPHGLNETLRYALLMNNVTTTTQSWGMFLPLYLGCRLIADDLHTGQIYVLLTGNPNRAQYVIGNWFGLVCVLVTILLLVVANLMIIAFVLDIQVNYSDVFHLAHGMLRNMLVILTATAAVSAMVSTEAGLGIGMLLVVLFNIGLYHSCSHPLPRQLSCMCLAF